MDQEWVFLMYFFILENWEEKEMGGGKPVDLEGDFFL